jgi:hypothetical protein
MPDIVRPLATWLCCALLFSAQPSHAQPVYGSAADPVAGTVLGTVVRTRDVEELRFVVLRQLTDRYANANRISATPAEKQAYARAIAQALRRDRERLVARRDDLTRRLAAPDLPDAQRQALARELAQVEMGITAFGPATPAASDPEEARAREEIAGAFVLQWKINRALYRQYGGRIVFQQGGPEPLDAYRRFLEEARARGDFEIVDAGLEAGFWRYYVTDAIHSFYRPGSPEEARAFAEPPWLAPVE